MASTVDHPPTLGMIGLGRMGANLVRRAHAHGFSCVGYDPDATAGQPLAADGVADVVADLPALVAALPAPRSIWIMVPDRFVGDVVRELADLVDPGDVIIDGGNTHFPLDLERSAWLAERGVHYLDVGTSGGVFGLERGFCLMIGGDDDAVAGLAPLWDAIAPGVGEVERTPGRAGDPSPAERGWLHCGPSGAGHYVKMVHNGVEYGIMAAYAEGLGLFEGTERYDLDVAAIAEVWRRGSVVGSWLLDLTAAALVADPGLDGFGGHVPDSGEGRWTVQEAIEAGRPTPVIADSLFSRFASRGNAEFSDKVLSAMRAQFGGHTETTPPGTSGSGDEPTETPS
ncbi:MAG: phosphogluconate dehydrogenase (NAD(+)-dependent, decarboxylating) [Acidimicrobiales bacterium]